MSNKVIPNDLVFNHGNYNDYKIRQAQGLDIMLIIYSVDRKTKVIKIRRVYWVPDQIIKTTKVISVVKKDNSSLSEIIVPNHKNLPEIIFNQRYAFAYDFSENINAIIKSSITVC